MKLGNIVVPINMIRSKLWLKADKELAKPQRKIMILIGNVVNVVEQYKLKIHLKNVQAVEKFVISKMSPVIRQTVVAQAK